MTTILESQYKIVELICNCVEDRLQIWFASQDRPIAQLCLRQMTEARQYVERFFDYSPSLSLFIFMYPTLPAINKAFKRELPHEDCCFVPIKGPESLMTFVTPRRSLHSLKTILVHEYSHIVFGCLTKNREIGRFKQRIPMWLDEGVALCIDRTFREDFPEIERNRLELIRRGADGWWPNLEGLYTYFNRLDGSTEFGQRGMFAYAYSYFCVKELISRYGRQMFVQFAASLASCDDVASMFHQAFGMTIGQFDNEMQRSLGRHKHNYDVTN